MVCHQDCSDRALSVDIDAVRKYPTLPARKIAPLVMLCFQWVYFVFFQENSYPYPFVDISSSLCHTQTIIYPNHPNQHDNHNNPPTRTLNKSNSSRPPPKKK
mmetsp:Transcript_7436/g.15338  ORF Transcript_7436/g.15338 Transcript_7436/m.15338 type:complete len:102 (+) Transcript_7436:406-711(+)